VCQLTNNCFYSDLYEKNDSAKLAIPLTNPFQEGKIKATFAHVAQPPFANRIQRGKGSKGPLPRASGTKIRLETGLLKTLMDQNLIHLRRL
jgi:hypothetical protein